MVAVLGVIVVGIGIPGAETDRAQGLVKTLSGGCSWRAGSELEGILECLQICWKSL